ncbi:MAG TPA: ATP-binding protein [Longimicrobiales bacterium]|nr:ATP-binding protein [Longimicrobiales bacterium]
MGWIRRLRSRPLRTKLAITAVGTAIAVIALFTYLSFGYWRRETVAAAEQQALLAAASVRSSVEAAVSAGDPGRARRALRELVERASISAARVYDPAGTIVVSTDATEEGHRPVGVWLPSPRDLPERGVARPKGDGAAVEAFLPLRAGGASILAVDFSLQPLQAAMDRFARLGLLLLVGSVASVIVIVSTMLEREVVTPMQRMAGMLREEPGAGGAPAPRSDDLRRMVRSVEKLVRREQETQRRLDDQAGLARVGEMAAEMAHEFKRPLASVRSAVSLLEQEYELGPEAQSLLTAVDAQLAKLTETMQDLFALARPVEAEGGSVELAEAADSALAQLAGLADTSGCQVRRHYEDGVPAVIGDRHRLEQAFLNVLLNAVEAMDGVGALTIHLRRADDAAVVEVSDTGPGVPEEEIARMVLPFYSTKPQGTGLGLPLVARVAAAHRGTLAIRSRAGAGTTVTLTFPAATAPDAAGSAGPGEEERWQGHAS